MKVAGVTLLVLYSPLVLVIITIGGSAVEQLSGLDAMFIHAEQNGMPMHISSFSVYDPTTAGKKSIGFDEVQSVFEKMVGDVSVMQAKLVKTPLNLDQPYWVQVDDFDIESHVHRFALPEPADWPELRKRALAGKTSCPMSD